MGFLDALRFLTRVPVRLGRAPDAGAAVAWFPVIGALVGAAVGGTAAALGELLPSPVAATLAVLVGVLVTGAFHEDGLADVADAFAGGWSAQERMAILDDPRHGTYGVAALAGSLVVRASALAAVGPAAAVAGAVAAHSLARASAVGLLALAPAARSDGLGAEAARRLPRARGAATVLVGVGIGAIATGWWVAPLVVAAAVAAAAVGWLAVRKIGGLTGDVLGAAEQVAECAALVVLSGLASRQPVWWA